MYSFLLIVIQHGETWKGQELIVRAPGRRPEMHDMYRPLEATRREPDCAVMFQYPPAIGKFIIKMYFLPEKRLLNTVS